MMVTMVGDDVVFRNFKIYYREFSFCRRFNLAPRPVGWLNVKSLQTQLRKVLRTTLLIRETLYNIPLSLTLYFRDKYEAQLKN